jgi:hypothetical protein
MYFPYIIYTTTTIILAVMLKSAILMPKTLICPKLPLNKNYLRMEQEFLPSYDPALLGESA